MSKFIIRALKLTIIYSTVGLFITTFLGQVTFAAATTASPSAAPVQTSPTQATTKYPGLVPSDYNSEGLPRCYSGGQPTPCAVVEKNIKNTAILILILTIFTIAGIGGSIFSIFMLIHAANHPIQDKTTWILVILLTSFIGGVIYYFAVKRSFDRSSFPPPSMPPLSSQPPAT